MKKTFLASLLFAAVPVFAATDVADAAMRGDRAKVEQLLKSGADVNAPRGDGMTALHWAAFKDDLNMVRALLAAGANVKVVTRNGSITPLNIAAKNGNAAMVQALLNS